MAKTSIPPLCQKCGGRTDGKVSTAKGFGALASCECGPMSWEEAIPLLAQGVINIAEGMTTIEKGSPIFKAMEAIVTRDLEIKQGRHKLPASWRESAAHLAGYEGDKNPAAGARSRRPREHAGSPCACGDASCAAGQPAGYGATGTATLGEVKADAE